ncbi:YDG domain-containing protein, partial [Limnohabitans sp.]|uniref:YDG domain-containing protein n=1 Tax=Limnohabitans sp. TaxID=1907725 RepID=UPI0031FD2619
MNKSFRSVWNASKQAYVAAAETVSAKGKPTSGVKVAAVLASLMGSLLGSVAHAQTAPPVNALPTGGQVSAGNASINQSGSNMVINQSTDRAAINWQTFNVGKDAQVQFQQPSTASVTLNRVMSADPSQIFGRITANGQVILTNPAGVYFGKDARVDVGGLVATTHGMSDADFMAGKNRHERKGATGSVVNEGEIKAALGGYIALLAPEVRNQGAVIAQMGTVALAAGEAVDLHFDSSNRLTSIRVEPSQIAALVENKHAVQAPGGLVIISAQSMDRLVGGVVKNSGRIEAHGLQQQGGRIILSASHRVDNSGTISANAMAGSTAENSGPAGKIEISAPEVTNSGTISATGASSANTTTSEHSAGSVLVQATNFTQTASGSIDLSAPTQGGSLNIQATGNVDLQGSVNAQATQDRNNEGAATQGGQIDIAAQGDIEVNNATLDASGGQGGTLALRVKAPAQPGNPAPLPDAPGQGRLAIMGHSTLSTRGRSGQGGGNVLLGEHISLLDNTRIDATGATGGGEVYVGGGWQGGAIPLSALRGLQEAAAIQATGQQAATVTMAQGASIDASATQQGDGGKVVLWSTDITDFAGQITSIGAGHGGTGGDAEVSGKAVLNYTGFANLLGSAGGKAGELLLDPYNLYIISAPGGSVTAGGNDSLLGVSTLTNQLSGSSVTISTGSSGSQSGNVGLMTALSTSASNNLTINAAGHVVIAASVSMGGKLTINPGSGRDFVMGTDLSNASGISINANGGFEKASTSGTSYLTGSITTQGAAITLGGNVQLANFTGQTIALNSNGGTITLNGGTISQYGNTAGAYAYLTAQRLYDGPSLGQTGTDIVLTYSSGTGRFLGQQGMGTVQYLIVGGGGGGSPSGGGGAGGFLEGNTTISGGSSQQISVGNGGAGGSGGFGTQGSNGGDSSAFGLTAKGGGGAGANAYSFNTPSGTGRNGGSGGGGGAADFQYGTLNFGGFGTAGQGNAGGHNFMAGNFTAGGGGGGAGGAGGNSLVVGCCIYGGAAGVGKYSSITGTSIGYAGGGAGTLYASGYNLAGAPATQFGGGTGASNGNGGDGLNGRGGGGGGANAFYTGGRGGSGIVVARYSVGNATWQAGASLQINAGTGALSMGSSASGMSSLAITVGNASTISGTLSGSTGLTKNGNGTLTLTANNTYSGATTLNAGTLVLQNNAPNPGNKTFNGMGALRIEPASMSFSGAFSTSGWTFNSTLSGLSLGKDGNTQAITVDGAINMAGPIAIYGGNITLNAGLTASGTNTITLKAGNASSITHNASGFVNAGNLLLLGGGTITLNNTSNAIGTLAASGVGSLTYVDSDALTIGTLGGTNGVSATGAVSIGTRTGNLTLSRNVATTLTSSTSAVVLNAGITAAAGTSTGGNIIVSGTPTVTVGSGSRATLFSGSITGSTGLGNLSGLTAGTGRYRYNADESTNFSSGSWTNLGTGPYVVYREQPTATLGSTTLTITYGDLLPAISANGLVNGDVSTYTISGRLDATSGNIRASATPYSITSDLIGLGYSVVSGTGTLTVNPKALTLVDSAAASRVYNGNTTASINSVGTLVGRVGSDVVTVSSSGATFDTKDVANNKTVTLNGITLGSTDAANYSIATTATTTASITPKALTVTAINASKTYDGLAYSGGAGASYAGFAGTETESVLLGSLTYSGNSQGAIDAGAYAITPGGLSSNNYTIQFKDGVLTVNPRQLTVTGLTAQGKVYDGTATATITNWGSLGAVVGNASSGLVAGEDLVLNTGTASFASKNVAYASDAVTDQTVTATGYSLANGTNGKASNYVLSSASATTTATITPLALNINGVSVNDKVYDGNATATVNGGSISKLGADVVSLVTSSATFASADVAYNAGAVTSQAVTANGFTLTGADAGNYSLIQPSGLTASITPKTVTLNSLSATSKTYDGTVDAPLSSTPTLSGLVSGQTLNVGGTATYASADAGEGILVTVAGLTLADGTGKASNYALSGTTATTTGTINRKELTIAGLLAADKVYDGTINVDITNWGSVSTGVTVGGLTETLTLNHGTASFDTADVARNGSGYDPKTVTATGYSLANGDNGGKASNYTLSSTSATTTATISPASLTVRANDDAKLVTLADPTLTLSYSGFVNGETASSVFAASGNTAPTAVRTAAGTDEAAGVYENALNVSGGFANNYTISPVDGNFTIVPAGQLLVRVANVQNAYGTATTYIVSSAEYLKDDETTIVDLTGSVSTSGTNNNTITLNDGNSGTANFTLGALNLLLSTANTLRVGSYQVGANSITETSSNFSDTITVVGAHQVNQKALTPTVTSSTTKAYDGTAAMTGLTVSSPAILSGDLVSLTTGGGLYDSRNVGSRTFTVSNVALAGTQSGDDSANYYVSNGTITGSGTISPLALTLTAQTDTKTYDGTTKSSVAPILTSGSLVAGDSLSNLRQTFDNKNASTVDGRALRVVDGVGGYLLDDGNGGDNYSVTLITATGTIDKATLTLSAVSDTKVYDRTTDSNKSVLVSGLVAGDSIADLKQAFDTKNAGTGSTRLNVVTGSSGYVINDGNSGNNYSITLQAAPGTITPASLIVSGITAANKVYDGTTGATINGVGSSNLLGLIAGDAITFSGVSGTFADKHAGMGKTVSLSYTLNGTAKDNYSIIDQATTTADITQLALTVSATGVSKVYDGGTGMTNVNLTSNKLTVNDVVDDVSVSVIGSFTNKDAGINKGYTLEVIGVSGADARNYSLTIGTVFNGAGGTITQRALTVTANHAVKTYDGQNWAGGNGLSYSGFASGEDASVLTGTVAWGGTAQGVRNAGSYTLSASGYATTSNYSFNYVDGTLTIDPAALTLSAVSETKVYDATTTSLGTVLVSGLQVGDSISNLTQAFDSKAVGTGASRLNVVTGASGYVINDGNNSANYTVTLQAASGEITQRAIAIGGITASSKEYNGNDTATVNTTVDANTNATSAAGATGWIVGDDFVVNATGVFSDKHVGTNKVVTLTSTYSGTDVGNYLITDQATTTADITPKSITITGITAADKVYNGTNAVVVSVDDATGWIETDSFRVDANGSFADRHVGTGKTVNLNVSYSGDDIGNYIVTVPASTTANITAKPVTLNAPTATRDYNGQTGYTATDAQMAALTSALGVAGDSVSGITLTFDDKNVGENKLLTASNLVINDGNGGNNYAVELVNNNQSSITRLSSVSWTGLGSTHAWFDPLNWFGGAVPDLANVATVVIPEGFTADFNTTGSYPAGVVTSQPVSLVGMQGAGTLSMTAGDLNLGNDGAVLAGFTQTGGSLSSAGSLSFTDSFSQTGGTISTTGATSHITISQMTGPVIESTTGTGDEAVTTFTKTPGPLSWFNVSSGGDLTVTASKINFGQTRVDGNLLSTTNGLEEAGGVTQSGPISVKGNTTFVADTGASQNATLLASNDFQGLVSFTKADDGSWNNVSVKVTNDIVFGEVETDGDFQVDAGGNINQNTLDGKKIVVGGDTDLKADGNITLGGPGNDFHGTVNADGSNITLQDDNDITLGDIYARKDDEGNGGNFTVVARGNIEQDSSDGKKIVVGGDTDLTAEGDITLDGQNNDFEGTVNAGGKNITLTDVNDITLGDIASDEDLTVTAGGDIEQDSSDGKKIVVGGDTDLT